MKIEDSFRVEVPVEEAWKVLLDLERIAPCLPGAQLTEVEGDEYRGTVKIKVGPITAQYKGVAKIEEADEANRKVVLQAEGRDTRGQGNASATVIATLVGDGGGTTVNIDTDLNITGKVAQFGRGVMADVSSKLLGQFADNLKQDVLSGTPTPSGTPTASRAPQRPTVRRSRAPPARRMPASPPPAPARRVRGRSTARRRSPSTSWTRPAARSGSGSPRSWPVWSWCSRSGRSSSGASARSSRSATPRADPSRIEPVFDPTRSTWSWASTPACRAAATASCAATRAQFHAVAYGVIRTPPSEELPDAPGHAAARARRADGRVPAGRRWRSSGCCSR